MELPRAPQFCSLSRVTSKWPILNSTEPINRCLQTPSRNVLLSEESMRCQRHKCRASAQVSMTQFQKCKCLEHSAMAYVYWPNGTFRKHFQSAKGTENGCEQCERGHLQQIDFLTHYNMFSSFVLYFLYWSLFISARMHATCLSSLHSHYPHIRTSLFLPPNHRHLPRITSISPAHGRE